RRLLTSADTFDARCDFAYQLVLLRNPSNAERERSRQLVEQCLAQYQIDDAAALAMATDPAGPLPPNLAASDAAAWTVFCNVLLNLDETVMKR
ncbi:MAG: hypothetical protein KDB23_18255, partial [Planctomycetales bacterium]|nr:hypothetical protein [Planctomycetales bacterium]